MSATGRKRAKGPAYVRDPNDDFPTPSWAVDRYIESVEGRALYSRGEKWLEPCAGAGGIIRAINAHQSGLNWTAVELQGRYGPSLRELHVQGVIADFRVWAAHQQPFSFDVAITNPPFALAEEILVECQRIARVTVLLLRVPFLGSDGRAAKHQAWMPDLAVLPERPQFVPGEGSDNTIYGFFSWDSAKRTTHGIIHMLPSTPLNVRKGRP